MEPTSKYQPDDFDLCLDRAVRLGRQNIFLRNAASEGSIEVVKKCIERNFDLNPHDSEGPLYYALLKGRVKVVNLLKDAGANVNHTYNGRSLLSYVSEIGRVDAVKFLLENKASANGVHQYTPLHYAAKRGSREIVSLLLHYNAFVDPAGKKVAYYKKVTPLALALEGCHVNTATALLKAGANPKGKGCYVPQNAGVDLKELVKSFKRK